MALRQPFQSNIFVQKFRITNWENRPSKKQLLWTIHVLPVYTVGFLQVFWFSLHHHQKKHVRVNRMVQFDGSGLTTI